MLSTKDATSVAMLFYNIDKNVRHDLSLSRVTSERDYTSRLVTLFEYPAGVFNYYTVNGVKLKSIVFSSVFAQPQETIFGCDAMIVFRVGSQVKILMFEAKWPRVKIDPAYRWDYTQPTTKTSHFTDQVKRQSRWTNVATIFEMFFFEESVGVFIDPFDKNGSSCVLFEYAEKMIKANPALNTRWNTNDLKNLIKSAQTATYNGENETNLLDILLKLFTCQLGKTYDVNDGDRILSVRSNDDVEEESIPIPTFNDNSQELVGRFMERTGLGLFQYIVIENTNNMK